MNDDSHDFELQALFDDAARPPLADEAFVATTLNNIRRARRRQLFYKLLTAGLITAAGAVAAPYVAQATLATSSYLTTEAGALLACACATVVTWRIARRAMSS